MELIGYTDMPSVAPGERIAAHVSCAADAYDAQLVRLLQADESPAGPGFREVEVPSPIDGRHPGRLQSGGAGSYLVVPAADALRGERMTLALHLCPTLPARPDGQCVAAHRDAAGRGWALLLEPDGTLAVAWGAEVVLRGAPVRAWEWYAIELVLDGTAGRVSLAQRPLRPIPADPTDHHATAPAAPSLPADGTPLLLGAALDADGAVTRYLNGKLDGPTLHHDDAVAAAWDLAADFAATTVPDRGPHGATATLVNAPGRAVTGHAWTGRETNPAHAPEQYAAVHLHDDDLDDLGWEPSLQLEVPDDLPSGVYAVRLRAGDDEDHVPFVVRPPRGRATARVLYLVPTFSYLAYANERLGKAVDFAAAGMTDRELRWDARDDLLAAHPEWTVSMYDHHADGSGVMYASWRRPIVNIRPKYRWWLSGAPQYLGADLYVVDWLDRLGQPFDVATDHDLHEEGLALLERYDVVLTSSHPEYLSERMMDAVRDYADGGGRLMYLGGNGFYWVTSVDPERPWLIEIRRGHSGTRAWESRPGEEFHSTTGERGGLWRHRGKGPNTVVGIGFSAQGWDADSPGYTRTERSREPDVAWVFDGVDGEAFGDAGLIMNGAAADELDRYDVTLGSPPHAAVLASSGPHSQYYLQVVEDVPFMHAGIAGPVNPDVRADLVLFETVGGGAVFSVGSKGWVGALPWAGYDNDVARITTNVLRRFLDWPAAARTARGA